MGLLDSILGMNTSAGTQAAVGQGVSDIWGAQQGANRIINKSTGQAMDSLRAGAGAATDAINTNYGQGRADLTNYGNQAQGLLSKAVGDAVGTVQGSNQYYEPYATGGIAAGGLLDKALGLGGAAGHDAAVQAFQASPGYEWQRDQATDAAARKAASLGMAASGNTLDAIGRLSSKLADQEYGGWLDRLTGRSNQGLQAASGISNNNATAGGFQMTGGTTGAGLLSSLGSNLGNLDTAQGNALAGIQSNLGSSLAGLQSQSGQQRAGNLMSAGGTTANLGVLGGQAEDSAANTNSGLLSKLLGGTSGLFGGGSTGGFSVAPGANGTFSVTPTASSGGGLLSSALGKVKGYL